MTALHGHECDRCGKQKLTSNSGLGPHNRDGCDPDLPKGWIMLQSYPKQITLCKACQRKAGLR